MNVKPLAALAPIILAACSPSAGPAARAPLAGARIGGPFALTDQDGRRVTDRDFAGEYRIVYFGYTSCPDVCPDELQRIGAGLKLLERDAPALAARIVPIFITVDPDRDTPALLKPYVANFHPRLVGLTGSADTIAAVAKAFAIYYRKGPVTTDGHYLVDHSDAVYLMDPAGKPLALLPADAKGSPQAVADEIRRWAR